jgi:hypothetical protein
VAYDFVSWSDGGAAAHEVMVPDDDTTYTAVYRASSPTASNGADLTAAVVRSLPDQSISGARGRAVLRITNPGTARVAGKMGVALFLSADATLDASDAVIGAATKTLRLPAGAGRPVRMKYVVPPVPDGAYFLLAQADPANALAEADETNNVGAAAAATSVEAPAVNLSGAFVSTPTTVARGSRSTVLLSLTNGGNVRARGRLAVTLNAATGAAGGALVPLRTVMQPLNLAAGASRTLRLRFVTPQDLPPGSYFFSASLDSANAFGETDEADNAVVSDGPFQLE